MSSPPAPVSQYAYARVLVDISQQVAPAANTDILPTPAKVEKAPLSAIDIFVAVDFVNAQLTLRRTRNGVTTSEVLNNAVALTQNAEMAFTVLAKVDDLLNFRLSATTGNILILTILQRPYAQYL